MELLDATIVSVAAPVIVADLGAGETSLQWMMAGYTLAAGAGLITVAASATSTAAATCSSSGRPRSCGPPPAAGRRPTPASWSACASRRAWREG
ncbi:hypothetical protein AB0G05_42835 [Nonomuraea wenchangensis]